MGEYYKTSDLCFRLGTGMDVKVGLRGILRVSSKKALLFKNELINSTVCLL